MAGASIIFLVLIVGFILLMRKLIKDFKKGQDGKKGKKIKQIWER